MLSANDSSLGVRRREAQRGARRHVVDDLEHRRALVAATVLPGQHVDVGGQVAGRLRGGQRVDAVREHAHLHADAGDVVARAGDVRRVRGDALGHDRRQRSGAGQACPAPSRAAGSPP